MCQLCYSIRWLQCSTKLQDAKKKKKSLSHANASETTYKRETEEEISPLKSTFEAAAGLSSEMISSWFYLKVIYIPCLVLKQAGPFWQCVPYPCSFVQFQIKPCFSPFRCKSVSYSLRIKLTDATATDSSPERNQFSNHIYYSFDSVLETRNTDERG